MNPDCNILNPLKRDGTSQNQRLVCALHPSYVAIDERELADLLLYARDYARLLRYYSNENNPEGDWLAFIENDVSTLVAIISRTAPEPDKEGFQAISSFADMFAPILNMAVLADQWYLKTTAGLRLHSALKRTIPSLLNDPLRNALSYAWRGLELGLTIPSASIDPSRLRADLWSLDNIQPNQLLFPSGDPANAGDLQLARERVIFEFGRIYDGLASIIEQAPGFLQETLESFPRHQPHMALFLAFLNIFKIAQNHLNTITRRHLNFYYRDVLRLEPLPPRPDAVHLIFQLAKGFEENLLKKNTEFKAGKDANQANVFFKADNDLLINRAQLDEKHGLKTIFIDKEYDAEPPTLATTYTIRNIYAAPVANSADGLGADIEDEEGKWLTLGGDGMPYARVGFALASPMFLLKEGTRTIDLTFHFDKPAALAYSGASEEPSDTNAVARELKENILVDYTGEKGWAPAKIKAVSIKAATGDLTGFYRFTIELLPGDKPVVPYDPQVFIEGLPTAYPVFRFILDNEGLAPEDENGDIWGADEDPKGSALPFTYGTEYPVGSYVTYKGDWYKALVNPATYYPSAGLPQWYKYEKSYPYRYFKLVDLTKLDIELKVSGMQDVILESDVGTLDPTKPFLPFGPLPKVGSKFYIGNFEVFQKRLRGSTSPHVSLDLEWADLPGESFHEHYKEYVSVDDSTAFNDNTFTVSVEVLENGGWASVTSSQSLFASNTTATTPPAPVTPLEFNGFPDSRRPDQPAFAQLFPGMNRGFMRLSLKKNFFHKDYPPSVTQYVKTGSGDPPNEPYTPAISSIKLGYHSRETIDFRTTLFKDRVERLFHFEPFGWKEVYPFEMGVKPGEAVVTRKLVPEFLLADPENEADEPITTDAEGTLLIGLKDLDPEQSLSMLFQMAEGSADPLLETQDPVWSYLADNRWQDLDSAQILADGTNGLLTSGIVTLALPKAMTSANTRLPANLHWIKVSVARQTGAISQTVAVLPQALRATFDRLPGNDPNRLKEPLPAGMISKLRERQAAVKKVSQPYASFGGKVAESVEAPEGVSGEAVFKKEYNEYYIRVSERLRHKNRGVTIFDYERLVLQQFPDIYKVKCLNHTRVERRIIKDGVEKLVPASEHAPGHVKLIVLPYLRNQNAVDPMRPMVSLNRLDEVENYLRSLISGFVDLEVRNPDFEAVQARFKVKFYPRQEANKGFYEQLLIEDIKKFLAPWLYEEGEDLVLGGRIHRSQIINFVEERDYVDFITDFEMDHIISENPLVKKINVEEAVATTSSSVLVSAATHIIEHDINVACLNPSS